ARYRIPMLPFMALLFLVFSRWQIIPYQDNTAKWHLDRGRAFSAAGDKEQGIREFEAALTIGDPTPSAHLDLGRAHYESGRFDLAQQNYRAALAIDPKHVKSLNNLSILAFEQGNPSEAIGPLQRALASEPEYALGWKNLAVAHWSARQLRKRLAAAGQALALSPKQSELHRMRGQCYELLGEWAAARAEFERSVQIQPDENTLRCLALLLAAAPDAGVRDGRRAVELARALLQAKRTREWQILYPLSAGLAEVGDFAAAIQTVQEALGVVREPAARARLQLALEAYKRAAPLRLAP
ncbi:MAG: tetratricopeptide (TPR) repeat protein, partial [Planctomycetota bacterium]